MLSSRLRMRAFLAPNLSVPGSTPGHLDFVLAAWVAAALLLLRYCFDRTVVPRLARYLDRANGGTTGDGSRRAFAVADSGWIATFAGVLTAFAWWVTVTHNGGCTPWSTRECFAGWPDHPVMLSQRLCLVLAFAYYLYELLGTVLGLGTRLKTDMIAHHIVTMALILIGYNMNVQRMQVMWQALFDLSNPILHSAKSLHASGLRHVKPLKWALFNLFAATFFLCRVVGGPVAILWPSFTVAPGVLPAGFCYTCWALEVVVYALQLVWFHRIIHISAGGEKVAAKAV